MERDLAPIEDFRHVLVPGEHEAFYFAFASPDGYHYGLLRTLFAHDRVLELVALRVNGVFWGYQKVTPWDPAMEPGSIGSGPAVTFECRTPWERWQIGFQGMLQALGEDQAARLSLTGAFEAGCEPARYRFGSYQQAEQEGTFRGRLDFGGECREGEWIAYRDHSWGVRPMGAASGWTLVAVPNRFYFSVVETGPQPFCFGRVGGRGADFCPVFAPRVITLEDGWIVEDREAGLDSWRAERLGAPLIVHLGAAGREEFREEAQPGDLLRDELGPVRFTSPQGEVVVGFLERAARIGA